MSRKRHTPEEIMAKLRQVDVLVADVLVAQGPPVTDAIRAIGITEVGFGTSCWMARSSTPFGRRRSSSRAGDGLTTACARMPRWAIARRLRRCSGQLSRPGRLRSPDRLRRPGA